MMARESYIDLKAIGAQHFTYGRRLTARIAGFPTRQKAFERLRPSRLIRRSQIAPLQKISVLAVLQYVKPERIQVGFKAHLNTQDRTANHILSASGLPKIPTFPLRCAEDAVRKAERLTGFGEVR
jgi:hypothetical protein